MKKDHIHKLKLHTFKNKTTVFFCIDNCDYRIERNLALGKLTICHRCGEPFQINQYSMTLVKPHCEKCHIHKGSPVKKAKPEFVQEKPLVEQVMSETASRIQTELESRLEQAIKTPIPMLSEDELL